VCLCGLLGSLLLWALPTGLKYYHIYRKQDDFKILFEQHTSEYGLGPNGLIIAHHTDAFEVMPDTGMTGRSLNSVREDWYTTGCQSKMPWPVNSNRVTWDEWGPSRWYRPDGLRVTQNGAVFCLPYSTIAIGCAVLLAAQAAWQWKFHKPARGPLPQPTSDTPQARN
jgi:hypothetical protein